MKHTNADTSLHAGSDATSRVDVGAVVQIGALVSAVVASACCWLPLLLIAVGISGGALSATFEAWRLVLLPVTFLLLGLAFYFTYRTPKLAAVSASGNDAGGETCSAVPGTEPSSESCCPPDDAKRFTLKKFNKVMLWVVTVFVVAFAFFPNYVGYLLGGGDTLAARADLDKVVLKVEGMTCEACAVAIEKSLRSVPGVAAAEVSYEKAEALVGVPRRTEPPREAILAAISKAGNYTGRFADQVQWTLKINGMTCQGCAAHIQSTLLKVPGVRGASVSYETGEATVAAAPAVEEGAMKKAVQDAGYTLTAAQREARE